MAMVLINTLNVYQSIIKKIMHFLAKRNYNLFKQGIQEETLALSGSSAFLLSDLTYLII